MEVKYADYHQKRSAKNQYISVFLLNLMALANGIGSGWVPVSIMALTTDDSLLPSGKLTMDEASWIASLSAIGGFFGSITFGYITSRFGRKWTIIFMTFPNLLCWILVLYAQNVDYLYVAQLLFGFALGGTAVIVLYISEIANDDNRGALATSLSFTSPFGMVTAFVLGKISDFYISPKVVIILLVVFAISFSFLPESPTVLMKQNRIAEATQSIKFYKNLRDSDSEILRSEVNKLTKQLCTSEKCDKSLDSTFKLLDLVKNPGRKALTIGVFVSVLGPLSGGGTIATYAGKIFDEAGSIISTNTSMIIVSIVQFIATLITCRFIERAGRRFLYIASTSGMAMGMIPLGVFMMLKSWDYDVGFFNWVPIVSYSLVVFSGILSQQGVIIAEIMPENMKNFCATLCFTLLCIVAFIVPKFFPLVTDIIGIHGSIFVFSGVCLLGLVFVIMFLPETRGKSRDQIMDMLC